MLVYLCVFSKSKKKNNNNNNNKNSEAKRYISRFTGLKLIRRNFNMSRYVMPYITLISLPRFSTKHYSPVSWPHTNPPKKINGKIKFKKAQNYQRDDFKFTNKLSLPEISKMALTEDELQISHSLLLRLHVQVLFTGNRARNYVVISSGVIFVAIRKLYSFMLQKPG